MDLKGNSAILSLGAASIALIASYFIYVRVKNNHSSNNAKKTKLKKSSKVDKSENDADKWEKREKNIQSGDSVELRGYKTRDDGNLLPFLQTMKVLMCST